MIRGVVAGALAMALAFPMVASPADGAAPSLLPSQVDRVKSRYPDFQVFRTCTGHFGGLSAHDTVVAIVAKGAVHRLGLIWDGSEWVVHDIGADLKQGKNLPLHWHYSLTGNPEADFRCGPQSGKSSPISIEGAKPLFDLKAAGLARSTVVCFATGEDHDGWDCVVYSPKRRRFRLWLRQAHAG